MYVNGGWSIKWVVWLVIAAIILVVGWWGYSLYERSFDQSTGWQTANDEMKTFLLKQSEEKLKKTEISEQGKNAAALPHSGTNKNASKDAKANTQTSSEPALVEASSAVNNPDAELPDNPAKLVPTKSMMNLNKATQAQLITIPGIGESKAKAIIAYRKQIGGFQKVDQLLDVKGIGAKLLEKMKPYLVLDP